MTGNLTYPVGSLVTAQLGGRRRARARRLNHMAPLAQLSACPR
jgi:hypothetical protein